MKLPLRAQKSTIINPITIRDAAGTVIAKFDTMGQDNMANAEWLLPKTDKEIKNTAFKIVSKLGVAMPTDHAQKVTDMIAEEIKAFLHETPKTEAQQPSH